MFLFLVAGTIAIAACSWHFFEKPLNDLKRHFDFRFLAAEHAENAEPTLRHEDTKITKPILLTD